MKTKSIFVLLMCLVIIIFSGCGKEGLRDNSSWQRTGNNNLKINMYIGGDGKVSLSFINDKEVTGITGGYIEDDNVLKFYEDTESGDFRLLFSGKLEIINDEKFIMTIVTTQDEYGVKVNENIHFREVTNDNTSSNGNSNEDASQSDENQMETDE